MPAQGSSRLVPWLRYVALIATAMALVPSGARLLEMSAKLRLDQATYFQVQVLYRGWA